MDTKRQNMTFGLGFLTLGIAFLLVAEPWFLGLAFVLLGGHRLYVAMQMSNGPQE